MKEFGGKNVHLPENSNSQDLLLLHEKARDVRLAREEKGNSSSTLCSLLL